MTSPNGFTPNISSYHCLVGDLSSHPETPADLLRLKVSNLAHNIHPLIPETYSHGKLMQNATAYPEERNGEVMVTFVLRPKDSQKGTKVTDYFSEEAFQEFAKKCISREAFRAGWLIPAAFTLKDFFLPTATEYCRATQEPSTLGAIVLGIFDLLTLLIRIVTALPRMGYVWYQNKNNPHPLYQYFQQKGIAVSPENLDRVDIHVFQRDRILVPQQRPVRSSTGFRMEQYLTPAKVSVAFGYHCHLTSLPESADSNQWYSQTSRELPQQAQQTPPPRPPEPEQARPEPEPEYTPPPPPPEPPTPDAQKEALDYFGLSKNFTESEFKKIFIQKSKLHHPDKGGDKEACQTLLGHKEEIDKILTKRKQAATK